MGGQKFFQVARFMAGGSIAVFVYWAILYTLTEYFHILYLTSSVIGWVASYFVSFTIQKFWTFKNRDKAGTSRQFKLYVMMAIGILLSNTVFLYALVECAKFDYIIAQIIISPVLTVVSFFTQRKIFATT